MQDDETKLPWSSRQGLEALRGILKQALPQWPSGPHDWQLESTASILDKKNQLVVTACGDGKTAAAYLHLLVLQKLTEDPKLPRFNTEIPDKPIVLMVTPLSDLGKSQASEMTRLGIRAIALDADMVAEATADETDLYKEICERLWTVVIVSPERLTSPEFDSVVRNEIVRASLVLHVVDEAHIVLPWARTFREAYGEIGNIKARIPPNVPILAMTATSIPGAVEAEMLRTIGFRREDHRTIRRTCERPNLRTVFVTLSHGLGGWDFPDIAWLARAGKKAVLYCASIEMGFRVATYLWRLLPAGQDRFRTIQMYNGLISSTANADALLSFNTDPAALIMIATVKFGMGIDVRNIEVSINLGLPESAEAILQQNGRAGRDRSMDACGFTYIQKTLV
ncbi:P-loop containing nucleoside triphosphate hydrolase protein, partial [Dentipellis sp. KUC8613]